MSYTVPTQCAVCQAPIQSAHYHPHGDIIVTGRLRRYCSAACRQKARRQRHRLALLTPAFIADQVYTLVPSVHRGRFALDHPLCGHDLTSGERVFVFLGGTWVPGHVEHSRVVVSSQVCSRGVYTSQEVEGVSSLVSGYYFVADDGSICGLCTGMRVRVSS